MQLALLALLLVVVTVLVWRALTREKREYSRFKRLRTTKARQKVYSRWLLESALLFGGLSAAVLLASWPFVPLALRDAREWAPLAWLVEQTSSGPGAIIAAIALAVFVAVLVVPIIVLRNSVDEVPAVGDVQALLPRTRGELRYGAALSVNAGIVEELLFRLAMPALLFGIIGDGLVAFALSTVLFGFLHLYQGPTGVIVTIVLGALFALIYLVTGSILWPIVIHALVDLRSFVLIPIALGKVWAKRP